MKGSKYLTRVMNKFDKCKTHICHLHVIVMDKKTKWQTN